MDLHVESGYEMVAGVLRRALDQTQSGKGLDRHASGEPFEHQEIMSNARKCGLGSPVGQVRKKVLEAQRQAERGDYEGAKSNILGAIIYAAAEYLRVEEMRAEDVFGEACEIVALDDERCEEVKEDVEEEGRVRAFIDDVDVSYLKDLKEDPYDE